MTECPSCKIAYESQPKVCENCGYQFASDPKANAGSRKKMTPTQAGCGCLSVIAAFVALAVFGHHAAEPKTAVHVGEMAIIGGDSPWVCGSSIAAHDEALKWSVLHDEPEMARSLARTRSTLLEPRRWVKVIDSSGFVVQMRKVRLLYTDKLSALLSPDKECWVSSEALTR